MQRKEQGSGVSPGSLAAGLGQHRPLGMEGDRGTTRHLQARGAYLLPQHDENDERDDGEDHQGQDG